MGRTRKRVRCGEKGEDKGRKAKMRGKRQDERERAGLGGKVGQGRMRCGGKGRTWVRKAWIRRERQDERERAGLGERVEQGAKGGMKERCRR